MAILIRLKNGAEMALDNEGDMHRDRWVVRTARGTPPPGVLAAANARVMDYQWAGAGMPGHALALDLAKLLGGEAVLPPVPPLPPGAVP